MISYEAPVKDMMFVIEDVIGLDTLSMLPGCEDATQDLLQAVLTEAGRFGSEVLAPLNRVGDIEGSRLENGVVTAPQGFKEAYKAFVDSGWGAVPFAPEWGGQGLPWLAATAVHEIWDSANLAFSLCPLLTVGAVEMLLRHGTDEQRATWLPKLVSGEWSGTMNLTEPQAGTDVGALRSKAVKDSDGDGDHYRITGQKIFITWGDHEMAENIVHAVLARVEGAPDGIKGISLFLVPKYLVNEDGSLGQRNDLRCASLEHKLGIMASPTAVMAYGDNDGAIGYLIGEENRGIEYMFTMMNTARLGVGVEGVAIAERAYQQARDYAIDRVQGRDIADPSSGPATIIRHPDVRRNLMTMRASTEASRALAYLAAAALDIAEKHPDEEIRAYHQRRVDLLVPLVKAWCTDLGVETASIGVQIHGGMGFIEETGAAQHYRDARITPIYEGANGVQALDLLRRKVLGDRGHAAGELIAEMRALDKEFHGAGTDLASMRTALGDAVDHLERTTGWMLESRENGAVATASGATPYLRLFATVAGGWLMARAALAAGRKAAEEGAAEGVDLPFLKAKIVTARFYADNILPQANALAGSATSGAETIMALEEAQF